MPSPAARTRLARSTLSVLASALLLALSPFSAVPSAASAQEPGLKLAVGDVGLGLGDVPRLDGVRLNVRDRHLERVRGVNLTLWSPHEDGDGLVTGLAVGVPLTGGRRISGAAVGAGIGVEEEFSGIAVAPLGVGAGERVRGIGVAGLGTGSGGAVEGLWVGGLGVGAGGDVSGVAVGGLGVGAGGGVSGVVLAGVGVGAGGHLRGLTVAGVGVGAGGGVTGLTVAGGGVGAPRMTGVTVAGVGVGTEELEGIAISPGYVRIGTDRESTGRLHGVSIAGFNHVRGRQTGLAIGILNIADELHGLQVGLLNIARNKDRFPVLPLLNYHR